jgi:hypothetical protein
MLSILKEISITNIIYNNENMILYTPTFLSEKYTDFCIYSFPITYEMNLLKNIEVYVWKCYDNMILANMNYTDEKGFYIMGECKTIERFNDHVTKYQNTQSQHDQKIFKLYKKQIIQSIDCNNWIELYSVNKSNIINECISCILDMITYGAYLIMNQFQTRYYTTNLS